MSSVARQAIAKQSAERGQRTLNVGLSYGGSIGPLHLLIDSKGIKAEGESEWNARKHGGPNAASGEKYILELRKKHWRFGRSRSPAATSEMLPCCQNF